MKTKRNLFEEADRHYQTGGIERVYEFALQEKIKDWRYCPACENEVPCVENNCLVCGQPLE